MGLLGTDDDPWIRFDAEGRSHYYHDFMAIRHAMVPPPQEARRRLQDLVDRIKRDGERRRYDCLVGVSGGVDSTYVALIAKKLGLRALAVHFDNGWNSELAVKNIENILQRLGFDLRTYVVDWEEFKDLQLAYLRASVVDIEAITDHAILATMYRVAADEKIRHILSGANVVTEYVMPPHWLFNKFDHRNIKAIHRAFGTLPLKTFPFLDWRAKKYFTLIRRIESHPVLNLLPYEKSEVKETIQRELGWRDYGGKHYESIFTRFYQGYILPTKFGIDKRKAHLTNLIFSGQITRERALSELQTADYTPAMMQSDRQFVLKKLGLTDEEFEVLMAVPPRPHTDFETERSIYDRFRPLRPLRRVRERLGALWVGS